MMDGLNIDGRIQSFIGLKKKNLNALISRFTCSRDISLQIIAVVRRFWLCLSFAMWNSSSPHAFWIRPQHLVNRNNKKRLYNRNTCPTGAVDHFINWIYSRSRTSARYLICLMHVVFEPLLYTIDSSGEQEALLLVLNLCDKCSAVKSKIFRPTWGNSEVDYILFLFSVVTPALLF